MPASDLPPRTTRLGVFFFNITNADVFWDWKISIALKPINMSQSLPNYVTTKKPRRVVRLPWQTTNFLARADEPAETPLAPATNFPAFVGGLVGYILLVGGP